MGFFKKVLHDVCFYLKIFLVGIHLSIKYTRQNEARLEKYVPQASPKRSPDHGHFGQSKEKLEKNRICVQSRERSHSFHIGARLPMEKYGQ
ncbi:hypothetical protein BVY04_04370 [bacterium M21]|nr:hypothetical protein BVY04_04220 [bacterium M21]OVE81050.1 hypothetical protein BVY04_04370 [bacterium M21]